MLPFGPIEREKSLSHNIREDEALKLEKCMTREVLFLRSGVPIKEALERLIRKQGGTLPILNNEDKLIGIVSITDVLKIFLPDFVPLMDIDFIKDYGALEIQTKDLKKIESLVIDDIMIKDVISVEEGCSLTRVLSLMKKYRLRLLPVVKEGKLVGKVSTINICRRFLELWENLDKED